MNHARGRDTSPVRVTLFETLAPDRSETDCRRHRTRRRARRIRAAAGAILQPFGELYIAAPSICIVALIVTALVSGTGTMLRNPALRRTFPRFAIVCLTTLRFPGDHRTDHRADNLAADALRRLDPCPARPQQKEQGWRGRRSRASARHRALSGPASGFPSAAPSGDARGHSSPLDRWTGKHGKRHLDRIGRFSRMISGGTFMVIHCVGGWSGCFIHAFSLTAGRPAHG